MTINYLFLNFQSFLVMHFRRVKIFTFCFLDKQQKQLATRDDKCFNNLVYYTVFDIFNNKNLVFYLKTKSFDNLLKSVLKKKKKWFFDF